MQSDFYYYDEDYQDKTQKKYYGTILEILKNMMK